jgi:hypothetical protein
MARGRCGRPDDLSLFDLAVMIDGIARNAGRRLAA